MSLMAGLMVKVSAILLLALVGALCLRTRSASTRRWVLAVGVVSAVAAPALHVLPILPVRVAPVGPLVFDALRPYGPPTEPAEAGEPGPAVASEPAVSRPGRSRSAATAVAIDGVVGRLAVTIWLVGAAASLGVLLVGLARLRWLRASSHRVTDGRWHRLCADLARSCGLNRDVELLLGPRPGLMATWGWRRPAVMLPASAAEWSAERMRVVLLHELAHARRGDWMLQMAAEALRCVWWFNPLAWMVRARLRRESEHAADDLVLAQDVPAAACAAHLVELARELRKHRRTWLPAPAMARPSHLERRLSAMLNPHRNRRPMTRLARFGSLGALVTAAILVAGMQVADAVGQEPQAEPSSPRTTANLTSGPNGVTVTIRGETLEEIVAVLKTMLEQMEQTQTALGELRTLPDDPDRLADDSNEPVRIGNGVVPPRKLHDVPPTYPPAAKAASIEGVVILDATIDPTGAVVDIEVLRSVPELDQAAVDAVEQWRWEPTLVDGEPVSILMTVTVNFTLRSR